MVQKQKYKEIEQNRKARNKPMHFGQLIYGNGDKSIQLKKDSLFNILCWEN